VAPADLGRQPPRTLLIGLGMNHVGSGSRIGPALGRPAADRITGSSCTISRSYGRVSRPKSPG
jgi:hypothetical protein